MMKNHHLLLLLVSGLAVAVAPACGDPEDPATNNATNNANNKNNPNNANNKNNPNNTNECGAGKVKAAYNGGAEKCYTSCPGGSECSAPQVCKDADGATAKICVDGVAPMNCQAGEVKASYQGGAEQCYKTCTDDASCGDAMKVCKAADGGGAKVCVTGEVIPSGPCKPDENFKGQIGGTKPAQGGMYATTDASYAEDSGLDAVFQYIQTNKATLQMLSDIDRMKMANDPNKDTLDALKAFADEDVIKVTGATVTAVTRDDDSRAFYLQDKKRALFVYRPTSSPSNNNPNPAAVYYKNAAGEKTQAPPIFKLKDGSDAAFKVGQKINFTVRGVTLFNGTPQISLMEDIEIVSDNNEVYVQEMTGKAIDLTSQWGEIVRIGGKLKTLDNAMCGTNTRCFTMAHGENEDQTIEFRTNSNFITEATVGRCVTWVGPLGSFPGFLSDAPKAQLNTDNYSWARAPFVENN